MPVNIISRPEVHGHRGCRGLRPENTLPAFLYAVTLGVDVLELDVVVSADGEIVVSHEPWMNAAFCLDPYGQPIPPAEQHQHNLYQLPYATIRRYDCGQLRHPNFPEQQTVPAYKPLLREVVEQVDNLTQQLGRPPVRFSIEVKSTPDGDEQFHPAPPRFMALVAAQLHQLNLLSRTTLLCFNKRILREARQLLPRLPLCLLVEDEIPLDQHLTELGFRPEVYGCLHELATASLLAQAGTYGLQVVPWTVNDPAEMRRLIRLGVTGITTDYPDQLLLVCSTLSGGAE